MCTIFIFFTCEQSVLVHVVLTIHHQIYHHRLIYWGHCKLFPLGICLHFVPDFGYICMIHPAQDYLRLSLQKNISEPCRVNIVWYDIPHANKCCRQTTRSVYLRNNMLDLFQIWLNPQIAWLSKWQMIQDMIIYCKISRCITAADVTSNSACSVWTGNYHRLRSSNCLNFFLGKEKHRWLACRSRER